MDNSNFGNILDRMNSIYLLAGGNIEIMKEYKKRLYYNSKNYPDALFLPSKEDTVHFPKFKLTFMEYACALLYAEFGIAMLNQTSIASKQYVVPYARQCVQKFIGIQSLRSMNHSDLYNSICIHFRCSDIPFNRIMDYNIYDCEWYQKALKIAFDHNKHFKKIIILSCHKHHESNKGSVFYVHGDKMKKNKEQCLFYINQYATFIRKMTTLPVEIVCNSIQEDLYTMHVAGCLICSTGSFAYYAGLTSSNLMIVSETLGRGWIRKRMIVLPGGKIKHITVQDYYNKKEMGVHLKCTI